MDKKMVKMQVKMQAVNTAKNFLFMLNNLPHIHLKLLQRGQFKKTAEPISDLVSNEIADRIRKVSKTSQQSNLEIVTNEHDKEVSKQRYISSEEKLKIIDDLISI